MTARFRHALAVALVGVVLALAPHALAQSEPPSDADATYSKLVADAVTAFDAGRFRESRELLARAHQLRPNARTLRGMGLAAFEEGRYAIAVVALDGALQETRQPMSPEQRAECVQLRAQANALTGRIAVRGLPSDAKLTIDGEAPVWAPDGALLVDQGSHTLTLEQPRGGARSWTLTAIGGHRSEFVLGSVDQAFAQRGDSEVPPLLAAEAAAPAATNDQQSDSTPTGISNGVAYAALAGAAVTAGLAVWQWTERESEVEAWNSENCLRGGRTRRANCGDHEDAYQRAQTWSWVAAGATIALSAGAITLLLMNQGEAERPRAALPVCVPGAGGFACRMAF
jgi:hypothetical protein